MAACTGPDLPFSSSVQGRAELHDGRRGQHGALAQEHAARWRRGLESRGGVDDIPGHAPLVRPGLRADDLAALDADAKLELRRAEAELATQALDGTDQRKARPDRALGVVVVGSIESEDRHRRVADELLDVASVARDRLADGREVGVLDSGHVLGVEPLGKRREADQVREQDRDDAPLDGAGPVSLLAVDPAIAIAP